MSLQEILAEIPTLSQEEIQLLKKAIEQRSAKAPTVFEMAGHLLDGVDDLPGDLRTQTRGLQTARPAPEGPKRSQEPIEHYLRLVFREELAAYYQFHLFPDLDAPYILGASQKRAGAIQHIRIEVTHPEALQEFGESCRRNPHFLRIEESTAEEFSRAPSNAI